jgi:hypothetical protein
MRLKFVIALFFLSIKLVAPDNNSVIIPVPMKINPWLDLWEATCIVESENNPSKINFLEGAYGIVQIRQCKLDEFNKTTSKNYLISTVLSEYVSREIFLHHCSECNSIEEAARKWNGGPKGMAKLQTKYYWEKIRFVLENI